MYHKTTMYTFYQTQDAHVFIYLLTSLKLVSILQLLAHHG